VQERYKLTARLAYATVEGIMNAMPVILFENWSYECFVAVSHNLLDGFCKYE
jgi:hypothetical protein